MGLGLCGFGRGAPRLSKVRRVVYYSHKDDKSERRMTEAAMFEVLVIRLLVAILDRITFPHSATIETGQRDEALMKKALRWAEGKES